MKTFYFIIALLIAILNSNMVQSQDIYVSDASTKIHTYALDGTYLGLFNNPEPTLFAPQDILFKNDGNAIVSYLNTNKELKTYDGSTGAFIENFSPQLVQQATRMKIGPDNLLYVLQWGGNGKVLRFNLDGTYIDEFTSSGVPQSIGIDWDNNDNLYVSSWGGGSNGYVRKFDQSGNDLGFFIPIAEPNLVGPTNIWFDANGDMLVIDWSAGIVRRYDSNGQFLSNFITTNLTQPEGYLYLPNGNLLIGQHVGPNGTLEMFDSNGNHIDTFASGNGLQVPNAIVLSQTLSLDEFENEELVMTTTYGNQFVFNSKLVKPYDDIDVFSVLGKHIETLSLEPSLKWTPNNYSDGVYIVKITSKGKKKTQKIIVKN